MIGFHPQVILTATKKIGVPGKRTNIGFPGVFKPLITGKTIFSGIWQDSVNAVGYHAGRLLLPLIHRRALFDPPQFYVTEITLVRLSFSV